MDDFDKKIETNRRQICNGGGFGVKASTGSLMSHVFVYESNGLFWECKNCGLIGYRLKNGTFRLYITGVIKYKVIHPNEISCEHKIMLDALE